jgi:hypothetical protein
VSVEAVVGDRGFDVFIVLLLLVDIDGLQKIM